MRYLFFCAASSLLISPWALAGNEREIASRVDTLLETSFAEQGAIPAPVCNDEDFLRRIWLDLAGGIPAPREATLFGLQPDSRKRSAMIDQLLEGENFADAWSRYWADVVFLRATEQRASLAQGAFQKWLAEQFHKNRPWDEITRDMITATGPVREEGATGLIYAHAAKPEEVAAEMSRIFLGIQMSCANCHDHPTDSWKREQFHELAAFLPRMRITREDANDIRSFAVTSLAPRPQEQEGRLEREDPQALFRKFDRNRDGRLSRKEAPPPLAKRFDQLISRHDTDKDGQLSRNEFEQLREQLNQLPAKGSVEYYMPDLNNPASRGTAIQPGFFIEEADGPQLSFGMDDLERRQALADYITSSSNPWFAKAFVNRVWGELTGLGFYMPVDDIGPERTAIHEEVLNLLSTEFLRHDYDVKWLYRTIANTKAYQREMRPQPQDGTAVPFASMPTTRLRADQIYNSLLTVLEIPEDARLAGKSREMSRYAREGLDPQRMAFSTLFGFDPSTPQEDILGNVPQAMYLMNSPVLQTLVSGKGTTPLARILRDNSRDEAALQEVYLLALTRAPTPGEIRINTDYIRQTGNRSEAFEDIFWSLLNSTEFLSKR